MQNNVTYRARGFGISTWQAAIAVTLSHNLSFANLYGSISVGSGDNTRGNQAENFLVANNIVVGNPRGISEEGNTGVNRFINNLAWNNTINWRLQTSSQQGSLSLDPGFVNYQPDGSGNYALQSSSPAIDKGITERAPALDFQAKPCLHGSECLGGAERRFNQILRHHALLPWPRRGRPLHSFGSSLLAVEGQAVQL